MDIPIRKSLGGHLRAPCLESLPQLFSWSRLLNAFQRSNVHSLKFALISLGGALLFGAIVYLLSPLVFSEQALPFAIVGVFLASFSTIISYAIVSRGLKSRVTAFVQYVMGGMMIKMFLGIISILIVAWKFKEIVTEYVLTYFLCYFIFLAFEVVTLMINLRAEKSVGKAEKGKHDA